MIRKWTALICFLVATGAAAQSGTTAPPAAATPGPAQKIVLPAHHATGLVPQCPGCMQIMNACKAAGFALGNTKAGERFIQDCVNPIAQGKPVSTTKPLPKVEPSVVNACKMCNPAFGQGSVGK